MVSYNPPFDRHDWVIDRNGEEIRYIIDFYTGKPDPTRPVSIHLDCRPALDSFGGFFDRVRMQVYEKLGFPLPCDYTGADGVPTQSFSDKDK